MLEKILLMKLDQFITTIKKRDKGIFGTATNDEINELKEEGIKTQVVPWVKIKIIKI